MANHVCGIDCAYGCIMVGGKNNTVEHIEEIRLRIAEPVPGMSTLQDWWMEQARAEIEPMIRKMEEYGGNGRAQDLVDMGRRMFEAGVKLPGGQVIEAKDAEDSQFIELAIYFYVIGKIGRWTAALNEGRTVSDDTLHDIVVYTKMLQRTRAVGGWPV